MGYGSYSSLSRSARATTKGYATKSVEQIFTQQKERKAHDSMRSVGMTTRECCDSEDHPETLPVILSLDVTASMDRIPHMLIRDGLPNLMTTIINNGFDDASLLFTAAGDHKCDSYPLQVGQFESGDEELDMWLERTYLEQGGGGNGGESYQLAWLTALNHTRTDAWDKRQQKGVLITIGDEAIHPSINKTALDEVFGSNNPYEGNIDTKQLLDQVSERWECYHIHIEHHRWSERETQGWKSLMGERCIVINDHTEIPEIVARLVLQNKPTGHVPAEVEEPEEVSTFTGAVEEVVDVIESVADTVTDVIDSVVDVSDDLW